MGSWKAFILSPKIQWLETPNDAIIVRDIFQAIIFGMLKFRGVYKRIRLPRLVQGHMYLEQAKFENIQINGDLQKSQGFQPYNLVEFL